MDTSYSGLVAEIGTNKEKGKEVIKMLIHDFMLCNETIEVMEKQVCDLKCALQDKRRDVDNALSIFNYDYK